MSHIAPSRPSRFAELDMLRGVAALWVLVFHYTTRYGQMFAPQAPLPLGFEFPNGIYGVYLFFMISGFVIFMTLRQSERPLDFLVSRFSRLYPAYWAAIALSATAALVVPLPDQVVTAKQIVANLSMLQQFLFVGSIDGVYWTLTVELSFYAVMFCLALTRMLGRIETCAWWWLAAVVGFRAGALFGWDIPYRLALLLVLPFAQWFILGIVFYRVRESGYTRSRLLLMLSCIAAQAFVGDAETSATMVAFCLVFHLCVTVGARPFAPRILLWLGAISYPLYLTHQMLGFRLMQNLMSDGLHPLVAIAVTTGAALVLATLLSVLIERPAMRLIRDWYRRRRLPAGVATRPAV